MDRLARCSGLRRAPGRFLLHNSVQTEETQLAPSARASSFSLHSFSFFLGQALGPMVYGIALPLAGATISLAGARRF
jgi:hypothetical protein